MKQLKKIYHQYNNQITKYIFPVILFLYPFLTVNQGVDVSDSTYSFSNFLFFERMEGMWVVSTYVSNVVGWLLTKLPFGTTLLGMKIYATLLISGTALLVYCMFCKWMPEWIVFVGEMIAIGFLREFYIIICPISYLHWVPFYYIRVWWKRRISY